MHYQRIQNWLRWLSCLLLVIVGWLTPEQARGYSFTELYQFPPAYPGPSGLTVAGDGDLYGTCSGTGEYNQGFVFRLGSNGVVVPLVSFATTNGAKPSGRMLLGSDGALYGTTLEGGAEGLGTIFRVTTNGELSTLVSFTGTNAPYYGSRPDGIGLGKDGAIYGCTRYETAGCYRVTIAGDFTNFVAFSPEHGGLANGELTEGPDGAFYGTMASGGSIGYGTIFRATTNGSIAVVAALGTTNGQPMGALVHGADGMLYGTSYFGGKNGVGTIFRCTTNGILTTIYSFDMAVNANGYYPQTGLVQDPSGFLYGAAQLSGASGSRGTIFRATTNGVVTTLVTFWETNGAGPISDLTLGGGGVLYGTTAGGGEAFAGLAFRLTTGGDFTTLASFRPTGGQTLGGGLTQLSDGTLWGTTSYGGSNGVGTVFCLSTNGELLRSIPLQLSTGRGPLSSLVPGPDGFLYGAASKGGAFGFGSLFRVNTNGSITPLAYFDNTNGANPSGPLVLDVSGNIYGTAESGGAGFGTIFRMGTNAKIVALATFDYYTKGAFPRAGLMCAKDGCFYGTTAAGGTSSSGTVFRVTSNGVFSVLSAFNPSTLGGGSQGTLVQHSDGNLYGTVFNKPASQYGTLFRVLTNGSVQVVATSGFYRPSYPAGPMTVGPDGALYGTSGTGVFRFSTNGAGATPALLGSYISGRHPVGGVILAQDGKFYGNTVDTIFCFETSNQFIGLTAQGGSRVLALSGMPTVSYQLERATTPSGPWNNLAIVNLNEVGTATYTNLSVPVTGAFYRARAR
ncbi:MAG: hypothetical protein M9920_02215 [Verrucomicrobiae bacterium]|nr:hypothetical protein [Verrucomicrobiae bacterium]